MIKYVPQDHHNRLKWIVASLILLNALDGMLTLAWVESGRATEINPLMAFLLSTSPVLFMLVKMLLVYLGISLLWQHRAKVSAAVSIYLCFIIYSFVFFYHLHGGIGQLS